MRKPGWACYGLHYLIFLHSVSSASPTRAYLAPWLRQFRAVRRGSRVGAMIAWDRDVINWTSRMAEWGSMTSLQLPPPLHGEDAAPGTNLKVGLLVWATS